MVKDKFKITLRKGKGPGKSETYKPSYMSIAEFVRLSVRFYIDNYRINTSEILSEVPQIE